MEGVTGSAHRLRERRVLNFGSKGETAEKIASLFVSFSHGICQAKQRDSRDTHVSRVVSRALDRDLKDFGHACTGELFIVRNMFK